MKKILILDGQGGKMGCMLISSLKAQLPSQEIIALGTNSTATTAMLKAGADQGATGENPVVYNCTDADIIAGPIGILSANALLGEVTPAMAMAVGQSRAEKVLIPIGKCRLFVAGTQDANLSDYISAAVKEILRLVHVQM